MVFSKKQISVELTKELNKGYNIERISNWAFALSHFRSKEDQLPEIENLLQAIYLMDAGPEFEYSEKELRLLSEMLMNEEADHIKKLDSLIAKDRI